MLPSALYKRMTCLMSDVKGKDCGAPRILCDLRATYGV